MNIIFNFFYLKSSSSNFVVWNHKAEVVPQGCGVNGKFAFIVHGWLSSNESWQFRLVEKFQKYRGGCIIVVDWGKFSDYSTYNEILLIHFPGMSALLTRKLKQITSGGVSPDNIYMYGHSYGARIVIDAGLNFGTRKISSIDGKLLLLQSFAKDLKLIFHKDAIPLDPIFSSTILSIH